MLLDIVSLKSPRTLLPSPSNLDVFALHFSASRFALDLTIELASSFLIPRRLRDRRRARDRAFS